MEGALAGRAGSFGGLSYETRERTCPAAGLMAALALAALVTPVLAPAVQALEGQESSASAALTAALMAACRQNEAEFAKHLTADNAAAYRALPADERTAVLRHLLQLDQPGRPLLSTDAQNHTVLRCETPAVTAEYRLGAERVRENLAFIPVEVVGSGEAAFGLVRESGGWRLLSLGLLLLDIPQLEKRWAEQDLEAREDAAIRTMRALAEAISTYRTGFGKLPESLEQLGPAPKEGASPDAASLVDAQMAEGKKAGYLFRYRILPGASGGEPGFELAAVPAEYGKTGRRSFFLDAAGKVHAADKQGAVATVTDPVADGRRPN